MQLIDAVVPESQFGGCADEAQPMDNPRAVTESPSKRASVWDSGTTSSTTKIIAPAAKAHANGRAQGRTSTEVPGWVCRIELQNIVCASRKLVGTIGLCRLRGTPIADATATHLSIRENRGG